MKIVLKEINEMAMPLSQGKIYMRTTGTEQVSLAHANTTWGKLGRLHPSAPAV